VVGAFSGRLLNQLATDEAAVSANIASHCPTVVTPPPSIAWSTNVQGAVAAKPEHQPVVTTPVSVVPPAFLQFAEMFKIPVSKKFKIFRI
jgi:hypothetical protein